MQLQLAVSSVKMANEGVITSKMMVENDKEVEVLFMSKGKSQLSQPKNTNLNVHDLLCDHYPQGTILDFGWYRLTNANRWRFKK